LSKIARGFDSDLEDVIFILNEKLIDFDILEKFSQEILPLVTKVDIVPAEFQQHFSEVRRRLVK
jgi:hypothetical protein